VAVLLRLAYLGVTNAFAMLRLLPMSDRAKDAEIALYRAKSHPVGDLPARAHAARNDFRIRSTTSRPGGPQPRDAGGHDVE
jgi:hypothetical protein